MTTKHTAYHLSAFVMVGALCAVAVATLHANFPIPPGSRESASVQAAEKRTPQQMESLYRAHKDEFDYLLGDWEFTAENIEDGKFRGFWSAVRLSEGSILDEYRVVGDDGQIYYATTTLRSYNALHDRWDLVSADSGTGLQNVGTGRKVGAEMHLEQRFAGIGRADSMLRIRYFNIRPDRFSWTADGSRDGGKTWTANSMRIEARRIGPARSLSPLTRSSKTRRR
jgi:hypothetical protein